MIKLYLLLPGLIFLAILMAASSAYARDSSLYLDCKLNISRKVGAEEEKTFTEHVKYKIQSGIRETKIFRADKTIWEDISTKEPVTVSDREIDIRWRQYFSAGKYEHHREKLNRITGDVSALNVLAILPGRQVIDSIKGKCSKDQPWQKE